MCSDILALCSHKEKVVCERYDKLLEVREGRGEYLPRLWTDKPVKLGERIQSRKDREKKVELLR